MKKTDARVQYTKHAFKQALLKVLKEKPIASITVKELCDAAGLNRGTFYLHYTTPNDVLMEVEDQFIEECMGDFSPYLNREHNTTNLAKMFANMFTHKDLVMVLLGHHGAPQFMDRMQGLIHDVVMADWKRDFPQYSEKDLEFVYSYVFHGSMQAILAWLQNEEDLTAAQIGQRLDRLGHYCHLAIQEFL